jgi:hypothetical protein
VLHHESRSIVQEAPKSGDCPGGARMSPGREGCRRRGVSAAVTRLPRTHENLGVILRSLPYLLGLKRPRFARSGLSPG